MPDDKQKEYQKLKVLLDKHRRMNSNLVVLTMPGLGGSHFFKKYQEENKKEVVYIDNEDQEMGFFNLLNFSLDRQPQQLCFIEKYLKDSGLKNKFAILIHNPALTKTKNYKDSLFSNHIYEYYYLGARSFEDTKVLIKEINSSLANSDIEKIYQLSGGIAQITKYLAINWKSYPDFNQTEISNILDPLVRVIHENDNDDLLKLGIINQDNQFVSQLLKDKLTINQEFNIVINFDLSFTEEGIKGKESFSQIESQIIEKMKQNQGNITKEEVSDIKWGDGKYDDYSDQAINKTMRRINEKLSLHTITTVPKIGFILKKNEC